VISTRFGLAVTLVLSVVAVALAIVAFMSTIRDPKEQPGRMVQTRINNSYAGDPISFPIDDLFVSRDGDGMLHALYAFPPGFYGHMRGCRVIWAPAEPGIDGVDGLFVDPCGGARFARDGRLLSGPADRGLDYFTLTPAVEGMVADTRTLYCGVAYEPPQVAPSPSVEATEQPALAAGTAGATRTAVSTTPSATPTATVTATRTPSQATATRTPKPEKCDRVSPNTRRP
jgi:hypothetical protein